MKSFGFGKSGSSSAPQIVRGDPNRDLLFNRQESRNFLQPVFSQLGGVAEQAAANLDPARLSGMIENRNFTPSQNQQNLIRETIDQINSNVAVRTGGPPTSGTIGRALGGQLAALDQQDIQNTIAQQAQTQQLMQLALQAALGLGGINNPAQLFRVGQQGRSSAFNVGGSFDTSGGLGAGLL